MVGCPRLARVLAFGVAACGSSGNSTTGGSSGGEVSGEIAGAGSTAQQAAQEAWIAEFVNENSGATISYDPVGSGGGREQFIAGGVAYAGSDAALAEEEDEIKKAMKRCEPGEVVEVPVYISPIAIIYNLEGVEELKLDAETAGEDLQPGNHHLERPGDRQSSTPASNCPTPRITPVNRSDESGTTQNFTEYLSAGRPRASGTTKSAATGRSRAAKPPMAPPEWSKPSAPAKARSATPTPARPANSASPRSRSAANGPNRRPKPRPKSSRSRPKPRNWQGPVHVPVRSRSENRIAGRLPDHPRLLHAGLHRIRARSEAAIVKAYLEYVISPEGQEVAAENAGSAPLSSALTKKIEPAVEAIKTS